MEIDQSITDALAEFNRRFTETGNPLFAWQAMGLCRAGKVPFPEWLLQYFDRVWSQLRSHGEHRTDSDSKPAKGIRPWQDDVLESFGFRRTKGGPSDPFVILGRLDWQMELATHVRVMVDHEGHNETDAHTLVADHMGESRTFVYRAWTAFKAQVRAGDLEIQRRGVEQFNKELEEMRAFHKPTSL